MSDTGPRRISDDPQHLHSLPDLEAPAPRRQPSAKPSFADIAAWSLTASVWLLGLVGLAFLWDARPPVPGFLHEIYNAAIALIIFFYVFALIPIHRLARRLI